MSAAVLARVFYPHNTRAYIREVMLYDGWGYVNRAGRVVRTPLMDNGADPPSEGYIRVVGATGLFGFVDMRLTTRVAPQFEHLEPLCHGRARFGAHCKTECSGGCEHHVTTCDAYGIVARNGKTLEHLHPYKEDRDGADAREPNDCER